MPSGLSLYLQEMLVEAQPDGARVGRFRFVAPALAAGVSFARVEEDFAFLCAQVAVPELAQVQPDVAQVVISLASAELEFGASDSSVIQFFEAFRIESGLCIWEGF